MYVIKYCGSQEMELKKQFYSVCNLLRFFIHTSYSYIVLIYHSHILQKKAEEAHNMFAKLGPKIDLVCVKLVRQYVHQFSSDKNTNLQHISCICCSNECNIDFVASV